MQFSKTLILIFTVLLGSLAFADTFEIIDGSANVAGRPSNSPNQARDNWDAACEQWKNETKDLNKSNEMMMISCDLPSCSYDNGYYTCSSNAAFKVKTSGTLARSETYVQPAPVQTIVESAPSQVIYRPYPVARPGYIWINGYWGWRNQHHYWTSGHWDHTHPTYAWMNHHTHH